MINEIIEIKKSNDQNLLNIEQDKNILFIGNQGGSINIDLNLVKPSSESNIYMILVGTNEQKYDITINSNHLKEQTNSRVHIKAVMMDSSKLNFDGMINIQPNAQQVDAYLQNDNLIIGDNAVINSAPQLEIGADDVKASHGVTITNIEETEKFYLMARGLNEKQAEELVVYGFINDFLELIEDKEVYKNYKQKLLGLHKSFDKL